MKTFFLIFLLAVNSLWADDTWIELIDGLGPLYHPVTTDNPKAQQYFNQGLSFIYTYNVDGAYRSFFQSSKQDPKMAMGYWGIAFALIQLNDTDNQKILNYLNKAKELSANATQNEKDYIIALFTRVSEDPTIPVMQLFHRFKDAMHDLKDKYPDDLDATALYAELAMGSEHAGLWTVDGKPKPGTEEILENLELLLQKDPEHPGGNHFYIHSIEGSKYPERALMAAQRCEKLVPASGHFMHMPAHIYINTGDYIKAAACNALGVQADLIYQKTYSTDYLVPNTCHCYSYLSQANALAGRLKPAVQAAKDLEQYYFDYHKNFTYLEHYGFMPFQVLWRFHQWQDIINTPLAEPQHRVINAYAHFTKTMAYIALNQNQNAQKQRVLFNEIVSHIPKDQNITGLNAQQFFGLLNTLIEAKIAKQAGNQQLAIKQLKKAILEQGEEPQDWFFPLYELIGTELLNAQQPADAEYYFRQDLTRNHRNPRSLFGLYHALQAQDKPTDAFWVQREYVKAWKHADKPLEISDIGL